MKNIEEIQFKNKVIRSENLEEDVAQDFYNHLESKGLKTYKQEIAKTPEEEEGINYLNEIIKQELNLLNLDSKNIDVNKIKFINNELFNKLTFDYLNKIRKRELNSLNSDDQDIDENKVKLINEKFLKASEDGVAAFFSDYNLIIVNRELECFQNEKLALYRVMLHEMIHYLSFQKLSLDVVDKSVVNVYPERVGYNITNTNSEKLEGFNEGVVDLTVVDILNKYKEQFKEQFNISDQEYHEFTNSNQESSYPYTFIVKGLIEKMANGDKEKEKNISYNFKKGQFTGDMMYLREIEKYFGDRSLQVLSRLGYSDDGDALVSKYFLQTNNQDEKEELIRKLLT